MSERTEERERTRTRESADLDTDADVEALLGESDGSGRTPDSSTTESERSGFRARVRERRRGLFSPRVFVGVLAIALAGGFLGEFVPLIGGFAGLLGVFAAAFAVGLASSRRYYAETGLAGAAAAGITLVVTSLGIVFLTALPEVGPRIGVIGAGAGLLAALVGHYFGRDLRAGLTADI